MQRHINIRKKETKKKKFIWRFNSATTKDNKKTVLST